MWRWPVGWAGSNGGAADGDGDEVMDDDAEAAVVRQEIEAGVWGSTGGRELRGTLYYLRGVLREGEGIAPV